MKKPLLHLAQRVYNVPLLISKNKLDVIVSAIGPRLSDGWIDDEEIGSLAESEPVKPRADYANATWSREGEYAVTRNGTAIIPIQGTLVRRAGWLDAVSGMRSYESIRGDLALAMASSDVSRVLLDIDSGGGEVNDCFDLCDVIYAARKLKPVYAFANDYAFSAAYAIGSAAQQLNVTRVGGVGSIGVICVHCDQSEFDAKIGVKYTAIYAGDHKNDFSSHEPLGKDVKADAQKEIDRIYGMFAGQVARNRNMSESVVRDTQARLFYGDEGVSAGLADAVSTFDEFLASIDTPSASASMSGKRLTASAVDVVAETTPIPQGESMPEEVKAKAADEEMPTCKTDKEPDPEDPDQKEEEDEDTKMEAKTETPVAATAEVKPNTAASDAKQISKMCSVAGRTDLIAGFLDEGLTVDAALDRLTAERIKDQPTISNARRSATGAGNAIAEIDTASRARAASGGITRAQAYRQALLANPQAYTEYLRSNPQLDGGKTAAQFEAFGQ